jgi:hypothetical protein
VQAPVAGTWRLAPGEDDPYAPLIAFDDDGAQIA